MTVLLFIGHCGLLRVMVNIVNDCLLLLYAQYAYHYFAVYLLLVLCGTEIVNRLRNTRIRIYTVAKFSRNR